MDVAGVLDLFDPDHARARQAYPQFVAQGMGNLSPWTHITGQIYLGSPAFRERMATQVPQARLTASDIMTCIAAVYGAPAAMAARQHHEAYHTAVWLLRRGGQ